MPKTKVTAMQPDQMQKKHSRDQAASPPSDRSEMKLLLVSAPTQQKVALHPEIAPQLALGWNVRSAARRVVEDDGAKWLVVLERPPGSGSSPLSPGDAFPARSRREERVRKQLETAGIRDTRTRASSGQKG